MTSTKLISLRLDIKDVEAIHEKVKDSTFFNATSDYLRFLILRDLRAENGDLDGSFLTFNASELQRKREQFSKKDEENDEKMEASR